jgi:membrane protein DedA with SNARE-associated domain
MSINHLVASFGYLAVFAMVTLEYLGIPLPGETALILASIYAGHTHKLSPWVIFAVAVSAAIIGDVIGYWIGHKGGYRIIKAHGHRVRLDERRLKIARYLFDRHGSMVVLLGRFVTVLRSYAAFLAGVNKMAWRRFMVANVAGGILWAGAWTLAAYVFGDALARASGTIALAFGLLGVAVFTVGFLIVRRRMEVLGPLAEDAYPGPLT